MRETRREGIDSRARRSFFFSASLWFRRLSRRLSCTSFWTSRHLSAPAFSHATLSCFSVRHCITLHYHLTRCVGFPLLCFPICLVSILAKPVNQGNDTQPPAFFLDNHVGFFFFVTLTALMCEHLTVLSSLMCPFECVCVCVHISP